MTENEKEFLEAVAAPPKAERFSEHGDSELKNPKIFLVFDAGYEVNGKAWHLYNCLNYLVTGSYAKGLAEYGGGPGEYAGFVDTVFPTGQMPLSTSVLEQWVVDNAPKWDNADDCILFLFPGEGKSYGGPDMLGTSGVNWCAYHSELSTGQPYALIPWPGRNGGCDLWGALTDLQAQCMTASHELSEAISDTRPGSGTVGNLGDEIGDVRPCLWVPVRVTVPETVLEHGTLPAYTYTVQAYWQQSRGACWQP